MKKTRTSIGESYLLTNPIFSSCNEEIDISFERNTGKQFDGFLFGVKSELDSTDKVIFAREMETSIQRPLTCMIDFISETKHGRCLIPLSTFNHIVQCLKSFTSNFIRLKLLKRGDNIFINFNFVSHDPKNLFGYHLDAYNEPWFLFCRLRTQGRIVVELGGEYDSGTIGMKSTQRKRSTVNSDGQQCQMVKRALELLPYKSMIRQPKCYCTSCSGSSGNSRRGLSTNLYINLTFFRLD